MEIVSRNPLIILDGAHNPDKMETTVQAIKNIQYLISNIHLITGFSSDKDVRTMIRQLTSLRPASIACTRQTQNIFRKVASPRAIANEFRKLLPKTKIEVFLDPQDALVWSKQQTKTDDIILVTGSIFLSGELRPIFRKHG